MSSQSGNFDAALVSITNTGATYLTTNQYAGSGYAIGDTFVIRGNLLGGTSPANDLTLTVSTVASTTLPNAIGTLTASGTATGTVARFVTLEHSNDKTMRDASDITGRLKERLAYNEYRSGTNIAGALKADRRGNILLNDAGAANQAELLQSNGFRLSYLKGRMNCGACMGGFFNANGPLSFNSSGQRTGS